MRSDGSLVKAADLDDIAKVGGSDFAQFPSGIATVHFHIADLGPGREVVRL